MPVETNVLSGETNKGNLTTLPTLENQLRKTESRALSEKFHLDKVTGVIKNDKSFAVFFPTLLAATSFQARAANSSKVVIQHSSMANQTHSFARASVTRSDDGATRRANYKGLVVSGFSGFVFFPSGVSQLISLS